jgi:uncharacterized lipoprotein YmbA
MRFILFRLAGVALSFSLLLLGACSGGLLGKGTQDPTLFYQLNPISESSMAEGVFKTGDEPISIALGVDGFPEYLARSQIVTRTSDNKLELALFRHWAEPLQQNFTRVLVVNLSVQLSTDRIYVFPWKKNRPIDYEVLVDVARFDGELGGDAVLIARWSIFDARGKKELLTEAERFTEPVGAEDYEAQVAAMSRALGGLSSEIAKSIKTMSQRVAKQ